jgi:hypothetical protein
MGNWDLWRDLEGMDGGEGGKVGIVEGNLKEFERNFGEKEENFGRMEVKIRRIEEKSRRKWWKILGKLKETGGKSWKKNLRRSRKVEILEENELFL